MAIPKLIDLNGLSTFYTHIKTKINAKYSLPSGGIPASDLAPGVIPTVPSAYTSTPANLGTASAGSSTSWARGDHVHKIPSASDVGAYALPSGGIPKTDLASAVQTSLDKLDNLPPDLARYPTDRVSGNIATFDDGADDIPVESLIAYIGPSLTGVSSITISAGKNNLFDKTDYLSFAGYIDTNKVVANSSHTIIYIPCQANKKYTVSRLRTSANERFGLAWAEVAPANNSAVFGAVSAATTGTVGTKMTLSLTTGATAQYLIVRAYWGGSVAQDAKDSLRIDEGDGPVDHSITLPVTVYGGYFNATTGKLTVTHANIASYSGQSINEPWISSLDTYSAGATPSTGAQVVYPVTPTTYDLTPIVFKTVLGNNSFWHTAGDTDVCYSADIDLFIKKYQVSATPMMFGATGDGIADDTQALLDCVDYCLDKKCALVVPETATLKIPNSVTITGVKIIDVQGKINAPNGIEFRNYSTQTGVDWRFYHITGTLTLKGLKNSLIEIVYADEVDLVADSGSNLTDSIAYNQFTFGYVKTLYLHGVGTGWINENCFYGGRIGTLTVDGTYLHNNNHWYGNTFEGATITFHSGRSNYIHDARFENMVSCTFDGAAANNYIQAAYLGEVVSGTGVNVPSWWSDAKGLNYFTVGVRPFLQKFEKKLTPTSFNYSADGAWPSSGKLHNKAYNWNLIVSQKIDIAHALAVNIASDVTFLRGSVTLYDANGDQITSQPSVTPFYGGSMTWDSTNNCYSFGSSNFKTFSMTWSRYKILGGDDSGVSYIVINLSGYGAADIDFLKLEIYAPWYARINPFGNDKLTGTSAPANGTWPEGTICYNTDTTKKLMGWFYNNGSWHTVGAYT